MNAIFSKQRLSKPWVVAAVLVVGFLGIATAIGYREAQHDSAAAESMGSALDRLTSLQEELIDLERDLRNLPMSSSSDAERAQIRKRIGEVKDQLRKMGANP